MAIVLAQAESVVLHFMHCGALYADYLLSIFGRVEVGCCLQVTGVHRLNLRSHVLSSSQYLIAYCPKLYRARAKLVLDPPPVRKNILFNLRDVPWINLPRRIKPEPRFYGSSPVGELCTQDRSKSVMSAAVSIPYELRVCFRPGPMLGIVARSISNLSKNSCICNCC